MLRCGMILIDCDSPRVVVFILAGVVCVMFVYIIFVGVIGVCVMYICVSFLCLVVVCEMFVYVMLVSNLIFNFQHNLFQIKIYMLQI